MLPFVQEKELRELIQDLTGEDINFRTGIRNKRNAKGQELKTFESDQFSDEDKTYWGDMLQSLMDEKDDDDNPFFDFGAGTSWNGEEMSPQDYIGRLFDLSNSGEGTHSKFETGLRTKLRQLRIMKAMQSAKKSGSNDIGKLMAKLKFMAGKQGFGGGREKGGYYKLQ